MLITHVVHHSPGAQQINTALRLSELITDASTHPHTFSETYKGERLDTEDANEEKNKPMEKMKSVNISYLKICCLVLQAMYFRVRRIRVFQVCVLMFILSHK